MSEVAPPRLALIRYTIYALERDGSESLVETTEEDIAKKHGVEATGPLGPRLVIIGRSRLIDAVEEVLRELREGEERTFEAPPEKAYGVRDESLVIRIPIKHLRRYGIEPVAGREVEVGGRRGRIVRVTERFAYIDLNHPLAGKTLKVWVKLEKEIVDPKEKAEHLVRRWLGVPPKNVVLDEDSLVLTLAPETLSQKDLETKLALLLRDLADAIPEAKKIVYMFEFELKERGEESKSMEESGGETLAEKEEQTES